MKELLFGHFWLMLVWGMLVGIAGLIYPGGGFILTFLYVLVFCVYNLTKKE